MTSTLEWLPIGATEMLKAAQEDPRGRTVEQYQAKAAKLIAELRWEEPTDGKIVGPMSPVLFLKEVIEQLGLRGVTAFALGHSEFPWPDGPEWASYTIHGVQVTTSKQHFRLYVLDRGIDGFPIAVDWNPTGAS